MIKGSCEEYIAELDTMSANADNEAADKQD